MVMQTPPPVPDIPMPPGLDPTYVFSEMMPLIAIVTIVIAASIGLKMVFRSPVGEALAQRIREGRRSPRQLDAANEESRAMLEERISTLHDQVGELAERLDFAERMLANQRQRQMGSGES